MDDLRMDIPLSTGVVSMSSIGESWRNWSKRDHMMFE